MVLESCRLSPNLPRHLHHQAELGDFISLRHTARASARHPAGEAALGRDRELFQRHETCRRVDPPLEVVLVFEPRGLGRNETEYYGLALGQEPQRLEAAGTRTVIFEEIGVDIYLIEQDIGDRLIAAFGPSRWGIATADMQGDRHIGRTLGDRRIDELR